MSEGETYGRGQVEWALWQAVARDTSDSTKVPSIFRTRIKRLLEIDREMDLSKEEVPPVVDHAFAPAPESSSGESRYSGTDAFCLGVGLDLLDAGFKQSEVVFLMYYLRPHLETGFRDLLNPPSLLSRSRHLAKNHSGMPTFSERGVEYADARVFILIQRKELKEIYPNLGSRKRANPVFLEPAYCGGIEILRDTLHKLMPFHSRILTIVEITRTAQAIQHYLDEAPEIRKGRPKSAMTNA